MAGLADVSLTLLEHPLLTRNHVRSLLRKENFQPHVAALGNLFLQRFDPAAPLSAGPFEAACEAWEKGEDGGALVQFL